MTNNEQSIQNILMMAGNVMTYRSFFTSEADICGEVDDAAQAAEQALLNLADVMSRYDEVTIMTTHNAHNPELVKHINKAYNDKAKRFAFAIILESIVQRDSEEAEDKLTHFPETVSEAADREIATEILENICDDEDLRMILSFVGYTRENKELAL